MLTGNQARTEEVAEAIIVEAEADVSDEKKRTTRGTCWLLLAVGLLVSLIAELLAIRTPGAYTRAALACALLSRPIVYFLVLGVVSLGVASLVGSVKTHWFPTMAWLFFIAAVFDLVVIGYAECVLRPRVEEEVAQLAHELQRKKHRRGLKAASAPAPKPAPEPKPVTNLMPKPKPVLRPSPAPEQRPKLEIPPPPNQGLPFKLVAIVETEAREPKRQAMLRHRDSGEYYRKFIGETLDDLRVAKITDNAVILIEPDGKKHKLRGRFGDH